MTSLVPGEGAAAAVQKEALPLSLLSTDPFDSQLLSKTFEIFYL